MSRCARLWGIFLSVWLFANCVRAADEVRPPTELDFTRQQRETASNQVAALAASYEALIATLKKRIAELEDAAKKAEPKK